MNFIDSDWKLILFKTRSFSTYSFAPPFLLMVRPPMKLSFWNYQQLLNRSTSNCFHINTYFLFQGFLQGKYHTEQHVVSEVASQLCNSELVKNCHKSWTIFMVSSSCQIPRNSLDYTGWLQGRCYFRHMRWSEN